jgi:hypothetical protein
MPRVDIWDVPRPGAEPELVCGFQQGIWDNYDAVRKLGEGGFGTVSVVRSKRSGVEYACK